MKPSELLFRQFLIHVYIKEGFGKPHEERRLVIAYDKEEAVNKIYDALNSEGFSVFKVSCEW